ncbi:MAG: hypothetical protein J6C85_03630 [Alphaproteobacteria bacterium]|nr:hypothetical protein [Alphaproteobacteria bacterium]
METKSILPHKGIAREVLARFYQKKDKNVSFYLAEKKLENGEIASVVLFGAAPCQELRELESGAVYRPKRYEVPSPAAYLPCEGGFVFFAPLMDDAKISLSQLVSRYGQEAVV